MRVDLPDKYPFKSPSIGLQSLSWGVIAMVVHNIETLFVLFTGFMNKIFHPNIDEA